MTIALVDAPEDLDLGDLPDNLTIHDGEGPADIHLIFATEAAAAVDAFRRAIVMLPADGAIWMAWPKKSSGMKTDISGNALRELLLPTGMVDNKVCAIDETWSGLRFVVRKENRADWPVTS